jgi:hypothetical protein
MNRSKMIKGLIGVAVFCWVLGFGEQKVAYAEFTIEPVPATISYQGRLLKDDVPADGTLDKLIFNLLYEENGEKKVAITPKGEEIGYEIKLSPSEEPVNVTNGVFTIRLNIEPALEYFDGRALWLKLVSGRFTPNGGSSEWIGPFPEQPFLPAPYALTIRPGAIIEAKRDGESLLSLKNTGDVGVGTDGRYVLPEGISVECTNGFGVFGKSDKGYGVYGRSIDGNGLLGSSDSGDGVSANSESGHAILAKSGGYKATIYAENTYTQGGGEAIWARSKGRNPTILVRNTYTSTTGDGGAAIMAYSEAAYPTLYIHNTKENGGGNAILAKSDGSEVTIYAENTYTGRAIRAKSKGEWPTIHAENESNGLAAYFRGPENDGTTAVLRITSTNSMILDGNEIDVVTGDPKLYLNHNSKGNVVVPVLEITGGSDIAEPFDIRAREPDMIKPGMVVSIDPEYPGKLKIATKAYDRCVAGIISGAGGVNPGMLMRQSDSIVNGEYPVALTGRVYCWADASNGPIRPGDLLTTSDTPGHAMKVTDYARSQGAILGKAMTSLEEGCGLVLVLVTLQ